MLQHWADELPNAANGQGGGGPTVAEQPSALPARDNWPNGLDSTAGGGHQSRRRHFELKP